jgi:CelD/BcsL family acetyltransferase involved in cellulose biosynthesis
MTGPVRASLHPDLGDADLGAAWDALLATDAQASLFQSPRWLRRWDAVLGGQRRLRTRAFHRDDRLVGVVAETVEAVRLPDGVREVVRHAGGTEVTDYLGPVAAPDDRAAVAGAWLEALAADRDWDEVVLGGLPADTGWADDLAAAAAAVGLRVAEADVDAVCPVVDLTGGYEAHLARLPGRLRNESTRKARKLTRDVGPHEVVRIAAADLAGGVEAFLAMAARPTDEKGGFFRRPEIRRWFHALADEYGPDGTLRVHRLDAGGLPAAMTVSLVDAGRGVWGLYNSAFDPDLAALAPGVVLVDALLAIAAAEGSTAFDLLRGDEAYKYRLGAVDRPLRTLTLVRP